MRHTRPPDAIVFGVKEYRDEILRHGVGLTLLQYAGLDSGPIPHS